MVTEGRGLHLCESYITLLHKRKQVSILGGVVVDTRIGE
jgi:hypothetical protein